jgi:hypothetical protein
MKYLLFSCLILSALIFSSCDRVSNPYPKVEVLDLDTTLYPGNWSDYVANEWPDFLPNTNNNRNIIIEDFTGHKCVFCPAAADLAHLLHENNPTRVFTASIHAGPDGKGDFQTVSLPEYPIDFTNAQGIEIGLYFGLNDDGFPGNPRGTVNRVKSGSIFQGPGSWSSMVSTQLAENVLNVNMQSKLNYYEETKGAFLHVEIENLNASITNDLAIVGYIIEDSLVGDQKMSDNSHNESYIHRDIHRGNLNNQAFGRTLQASDLINF